MSIQGIKLIQEETKDLYGIVELTLDKYVFQIQYKNNIEKLRIATIINMGEVAMSEAVLAWGIYRLKEYLKT